jgi:hypothetical protein
MMRKLLTILVLLATPHLVGGQGAGYVQVTGTKSCYGNGSVTAAFVNMSGGNQLPLLNGSVFPTTGVTNFNSAGVMSINLADNSQVIPAPSQWTFTVCAKSGGGPPCGTFQTSIVGPGPVDVSTQMAAFSCAGSGGGGVAAPPNNAMQFNQNGNLAGASLIMYNALMGEVEKLPKIFITSPDFATGCPNAVDPLGILDSTCAAQNAYTFQQEALVQTSYGSSQNGPLPVVVWPAGNYRITGAIRIPSNTWTMCDSQASTIITQYSPTANWFTVNYATPYSPSVYGVYGGISGCTFQGGLIGTPGVVPYNGNTGSMIEMDAVNFALYDIAFNNCGCRALNISGYSQNIYGRNLFYATTRWARTGGGQANSTFENEYVAGAGQDEAYCFDANCIEGVPSEFWAPSTVTVTGVSFDNNGNATFTVNCTPTASCYAGIICPSNLNCTGSGGMTSSPILPGHAFTVSGVTAAGFTQANGTFLATAVAGNPCSGSSCGSASFTVTAALAIPPGSVATTGTATIGSTALVVASATGIVQGDTVTGTGIAYPTTVAGISGTTVTLSQATTAAISGGSVAFSGGQWDYGPDESLVYICGPNHLGITRATACPTVATTAGSTTSPGTTATFQISKTVSANFGVVNTGPSNMYFNERIDTLWHANAIQIQPSPSQQIDNVLYEEGYSAHGETEMNGGYRIGGFMPYTMLTQALPANTNPAVTSVVSNSWFGSYANDASYFINKLAIATSGSGQTPGTYYSTDSMGGGASIQYIVSGTAPYVGQVIRAYIVNNPAYAAGVTPVFPPSSAAGGTGPTFTVTMQQNDINTQQATEWIVPCDYNPALTAVPSLCPVATGQIVSGTVANPGSGYANNDRVTVVQSGGSNGAFTLTVSAGAITAMTPVSNSSGAINGSGYTNANGLATTGGTGTGLTVNITTGIFTNQQEAALVAYSQPIAGVSGPQLNVQTRNTGGSTAPAGTPWPAGSLIGFTRSFYNSYGGGAVKLSMLHLSDSIPGNVTAYNPIVSDNGPMVGGSFVMGAGYDGIMIWPAYGSYSGTGPRWIAYVESVNYGNGGATSPLYAPGCFKVVYIGTIVDAGSIGATSYTPDMTPGLGTTYLTTSNCFINTQYTYYGVTYNSNGTYVDAVNGALVNGNSSSTPAQPLNSAYVETRPAFPSGSTLYPTGFPTQGHWFTTGYTQQDFSGYVFSAPITSWSYNASTGVFTGNGSGSPSYVGTCCTPPNSTGLINGTRASISGLVAGAVFNTGPAQYCQISGNPTTTSFNCTFGPYPPRVPVSQPLSGTETGTVTYTHNKMMWTLQGGPGFISETNACEKLWFFNDYSTYTAAYSVCGVASSPSATINYPTTTTINSSGPVRAAQLTVNATTPSTSNNVFVVASGAWTPTAVAAQSCVNQNAPVTGIVTTDIPIALVPPALGNLDVSLVGVAANAIIVHFCNPTAASITPPASGTWTFTVLH